MTAATDTPTKNWVMGDMAASEDAARMANLRNRPLTYSKRDDS